jgi:hypothetical protein
MNEYDSRAQAKLNAEFITPQPLRDFLKQKVKGEKLSVLEPAIGSGQLIFEFQKQISKITGYDVNPNVAVALLENFGKKINFKNFDFISASENEKYDVAIANYPFSLKPSESQKEYILNDHFLNRFYNKKVTGVLDFVFIIKSFQHAEQGFYFCFPGIGYRFAEKKFRMYLIENKLLREYGILKNCAFEHTSVDIIFLHLSKKPNSAAVKRFYKDFKNNEYYEDEVKQFDDNFTFEHLRPPEPLKEKANPIELELSARRVAFNNFKNQVEFSISVWNLDREIRGKIPSPAEWVSSCVKELNAALKKQQNYNGA